MVERVIMNFGILKEIKEGEHRVILTPAEVAVISQDGHRVYVEQNAGVDAGFENEEYVKAGATILSTAKEIYETCDFVAKVKEIEPCEYDLLHESQIIFTCIHPAAHPGQVDALLNKKVTAFTAEDSHEFGSPNSEAAGKAGAFMGLFALMSVNGGCGKFASGLGGAPNVKALVIGAGTVGKAAVSTLYSMGAYVSVCDVNLKNLKEISEKYSGRIETFLSNKYNIANTLPKIDLVVNCVRWPKHAKEHLITREMVASMHKGSAIADISCDEGVIETFHSTTHAKPFYIEEGVVHYCVSNIPALIAGSTSVAYASSVLPHIRNILNMGIKRACQQNGYLRRSLTTYNGYLTHEETSGIQQKPWVKPEVILNLSKSDLAYAPKNTSTSSSLFYKEYESLCQNI